MGGSGLRAKIKLYEGSSNTDFKGAESEDRLLQHLGEKSLGDGVWTFLSD